jgi:uncharacterized protein (DUF58 family)
VLIKFEVLGPFPDEAAYERGIVRLVSLAAYFLKLDYQVAVELPGEAVPFDEGQVHLRRILRAAALAPRAQEAVERPAMNVPWPPVATIMVRVSGLEVEVEARS